MANSQIDIKRLSFPNADAQLLLGLKGDKGDTGDKGDKGDTGDTGNGIASITHTGTSGAVKTYTITFTDGTSQTYDVTDGQVTTEQMDTAIDNAVTDVKSDLSERTRNLNTSRMGRWGNASDGKVYSRNNTYYGMESFIPIVEGASYAVKFWGIASASWTYLFVNDSGTVISRAGYNDIAGRVLTAPTGATKLNVFCKADSDITITSDTHLQIELGTASTEYIPSISATDYIVRRIVDEVFQIYDVIDSSADLNTVPKTGAYRWNSSSVPSNVPEEQAGRLINILSDASSQSGAIQLVISSATTQKLFIRYRVTNGWGTWIELASKTYVDDKFSAITISEGAEWEA